MHIDENPQREIQSRSEQSRKRVPIPVASRLGRAGNTMDDGFFKLDQTLKSSDKAQIATRTSGNSYPD